ncbi:MAG: hypothetical protein GY757_09440 [bacterium]|nr:hypothetical protein [bacterium]
MYENKEFRSFCRNNQGIEYFKGRITMALFARKKKKSGNGICTDDEILGFLDEVIRYRTALTIISKNDQIQSYLYEIDEKNKVLKVQDDPTLDDLMGKSVRAGFAMDSTFYMFSSKIVEHNGRPYLTMPDEILRKERRTSPRTNFSPRERIKVGCLQGLGTGVGVTGFATDVSTNGICLAIERAIILKNEREVQPSHQLLPKGMEMVIIKVNKLPGIPVFDTSGKVNRVFMKGGWKLAIEFPKLQGKIESQIKRLLEERAPKFKPVRRSRKKRQEMDAARKKEAEERNNEAAAGAADADAPAPVEQVERKPKVSFSPMEPVASKTESAQAAAPSAAPADHKDSLIILGNVLDKELAFLNDNIDLQTVHVDNPMRIVKSLNEKHPRFLLLPLLFNEQSMMDYLQKINSMGVLSGVEIILFYEGEMPMRELVKSKMLGIKNTLKLPLENQESLLSILQKKPA